MDQRWTAVVLLLGLLGQGCGGDKTTSPDGPDGGRATGEVLTVTLPDAVTMEFVWIRPGTFSMGSPETELFGWPDEQPRHQVTLTQGFWLGKHEVTQGQWQAVMGTTPWVGQDHAEANASHPAVYVSWEDAQRLVQMLNQAAGDSLYRLPTEAEWEYACRAGTQTEWSFGDDDGQLASYAWFYDNCWAAGLEYAQPVASKQPSGWDLHDMHGNVSEWVQDWFGPYNSRAQTDPVGPLEGSYRVVRGGAFCNYYRLTRSAFRDYGITASGYRDISIRLLRTE